ncbi:MAG TPA: tetratricopeptide repeat protein [Patescibacteria group bacterium]|nr:tetratricopeptide repeat protein [Patescibacteria group bacterium]
MRTFILSLSFLLFAFSGCGSDASKVVPPEQPKAEIPPPRIVRVLVVPFQDRNAHDETEYVSMGLAVFATARIEELSRSLDPAKGLKLEAVVGPHAYPAEAARLRADRRASVDAAAVLAEAKRAGATHVLTGSYGGRVEKWSLAVELYEVRADALVSVGTAEETRKIFAWSKDVPKPDRAGVQAPAIHAMFGSLAASVFAKGGIVLPDEAIKALSTPQTPDIVAFIRLSEAYRALLLGEGDEAMALALDKAESAVRVWPDYQIGLRLYAWLLWQRGRTVAALKQYGEALARDPNDVRALIALGRVEIAEGQYDAGRDALNAAAKLRPDDAVIHFWLGEAHAKLGDIAEAIARYERSRELDPSNLDTHRALSGLYAGQRRYADAAKELAVVVDGEPENLDAVFLLAACLRAAGQPEAAIEAYAKASARFPTESRLRKFRGDLLSELKRGDEAAQAYAEAKKLMPKDARWSDTPLWGAKLVRKIHDVETVRVEMERLRSDFQLAVSDGVWDLSWNKKEACAPGRAGSSFLLARETGKAYDAHGAELQGIVRDLRASLKNGEGAALTPDELALAEGALRYEGIALQDLREMRTGYDELKPMLSKYGCDVDPATMPIATMDGIRERNLHREVVMPEPKPRDTSGISPVVPTDARRVVKFSIENKGRRDYVLVLDGKPLDPAIEPGKRQTYATTLGEHAFCLLPKEQAAACGTPGASVRKADFHEGWNAVIQQDL